MHEHGSVLDTSLFYLSTTQLGDLFFWDACMILGMTPIVVWCQACSLDWIPAGPLDWGTRLLFELSFTAVGLHWTRASTWPWVQRIFFSLHTMVLAMKIHSYGARNATFREKAAELNDLEEEERTLASHSFRGPHETERLQEVSVHRSDWTRNCDFHLIQKNACVCSSRLLSPLPCSSIEVNRSSPPPSPFSSDTEDLSSKGTSRHTPSADLCPGTVAYPDNLTVANWVDYVLIPSLVYEIHFPRTDRIRPWYVFEKALATFGSMFLMYVTMEQSLIPSVKYAATTSLLYALPHLMFPFLITFLLGFFIVFECVCNGFAELTRFADRRFYDDWWNSSTWDEFARKWNRPVHLFLLRHVYFPLRHGLGLPKAQANFYTFLFSALAHELAVWIMAGRLRMFFFAMQMLQIPLVYYSQRVKEHVKAWGNGIFWVSMMLGPSMMTFVYTRDHYLEQAALASESG
ncbi:MBOAT, membrane-bound O-acyltransferase family-domain-containing protein [Piptocephalis cylindrospora]|uniref:O-acyltransferase n=1 Tax=Piptocephalis cylindrospora TaxID=1907219 RepID=A0A4V1IYD1_9FUNG|nr:MBOAT, membrane-bound O-acyltransferase family-domain-containing protein [Piptocephalis cylindrospora]|eukprot:RKP14139.1 MBOAT, membrane-bound O-acyltransferase family-domain-containing protein [Piptocephalis cylindrospora]